MAEQIIALDGPAGSGKSTVSKHVASTLDFGYLDTGSVYRALALWLQSRGVELTNLAEISPLLVEFEHVLSMSNDPDQATIAVQGMDFTDRVREPDASQAASTIARVPEVREFLVGLFRRLIVAAPHAGIVVEGRDITTVVAPEAQLRLLLTAREEVRMRRRGLEAAVNTQLSQEISARDASDATMVDFFNAAPGVEVVDTSDLSFEEVTAELLRLWAVSSKRNA